MYLNDGWTKGKRHLLPKIIQCPTSHSPHLCFFASEDIEAGTELRYDYGNPKLPWRKVIKVINTYSGK